MTQSVDTGTILLSGADMYLMAPFVLLLLSIAVIPFISKKWWDKYYPLVSLSLGAVTAFYYLFLLHNPGILKDTLYQYSSFIILIGSLYIVSGGIHVSSRGVATPFRNVVFLGAGAVLSNLFGTMGASLILIRPFLRVNKERFKGFHLVFFVFLVCNIGGALLPIADPPLFLGYLMGIPFLWVFKNVWVIWLMAVILLLILFYILDSIDYRRYTRNQGGKPVERIVEKITVKGIYNIAFLCVIALSVFINHPPLLRECIMIFAAIGSWLLTHKEIYKNNGYNLFPLKEISILFLGIFLTIIPVLNWLEINAMALPFSTPGGYYWGCGILSSFLDNAPTYLNFMSAAIGINVNPEALKTLSHFIATHGEGVGNLAGAHAEQIRLGYETLVKNYGSLAVSSGDLSVEKMKIGYLIANYPSYIRAISVGAVFFGACTYIGNAPNYVVKTIVEGSGMKTPSFHAYIIRYTLPILLPLFLVIWFIWFT